MLPLDDVRAYSPFALARRVDHLITPKKNTEVGRVAASHGDAFVELMARRKVRLIYLGCESGSNQKSKREFRSIAQCTLRNCSRQGQTVAVPGIEPGSLACYTSVLTILLYHDGRCVRSWPVRQNVRL